MNECRDTTGKPANRRGLECPRCGCKHFHVLYTRAAIGGRIPAAGSAATAAGG